MKRKCPACGDDLPEWDDEPLCHVCQNRAAKAQADADKAATSASGTLSAHPLTGNGIPPSDNGEYKVVGYEPAYKIGLEYLRYHPDGRQASGWESVSIISGNMPGYTRAFVVRESYARITGDGIAAENAARENGYTDALATAPGYVKLTKERVN